MASFKVNPDTVSETGLHFRIAPVVDPSSIAGALLPGDVVEATGHAQGAGAVVWLPVRVVNSSVVPAGLTGFVMLSAGGRQFLSSMTDSASAYDRSLADAVAQAATQMQLPPLLLKAFLGVEGADANSPDGVLQVTAGTRPYVISRLSRTTKLMALGLSDNPSLSDVDLNARFAASYAAKDLLVQVLTGAQLIREQLDQFDGYVVLAALAYNAGTVKAHDVINTFGGDALHTALQYHKSIGSGLDQVTVQPGIVQTDPSNGKQWVRFPVIANDTSLEIFQYLYMRQVPGRNFGILDFIFRPALLAPLNLYQGDVPPGDDVPGRVLLVSGGQFAFKGDAPAPPIDTPPAPPPRVVKVFNTLPLSQRDPQWKNVILGFGDASSTIGAYGCTLVCLTMVANGMGYDETPATLNEKLKALGPNVGFTGPLIMFAGLQAALPGIQFTNFVRCRDVDAPMASVDSALDAGLPVVVEVDFSPAPGLQNHWVLLYARQALDPLGNGSPGSDYLIHDPWPVPAESSASLMQRYGFVGSAVRIIKTAVFYDGHNPNAQPPLTVVVNNDPDITDAGGLALRDAPLTGNLLVRLPCGTPLQSVEPPKMVTQKLGQLGVWLNVKDADGRVGYVPAWMVHALAPTTPTPSTSPVVQQAAVSTPLPISARAFTDAVQEPLRDPRAMDAVNVQVLDNADIARANGLALRASPGGGIIRTRLPAGTLLSVREPVASALAKIGQTGQWLNVITAGSKQGFVAACYVILTPSPETPVSEALVPPATMAALPQVPSPNLVATESVAPLVRTQPVITATPVQIAPVKAEVIAQGVVIASIETPLLDAPSINTPTNVDPAWRVSAGTPLHVTEGSNWAAKLGHADQFIRVQSYAFKEGYVQASLVSVPEYVDRRTPAVDTQLPRGTSAWLYGLHDPYDRRLFAEGGKAGWVLFSEDVETGAGNVAYANWSYAGYGVIARLSNGNSNPCTVVATAQSDAFAALCAKWVLNSAGCNTWVIGNEVNNSREWPEGDRHAARAITPESYAACFNLTRASIKAVQPNAIVIPGALDPYQGLRVNSLEWFTRMLASINDLDGIALHCRTNGYAPGLVTDLSRLDDEALHWQYQHFRAYSTFLDVIPARWRSRPVFITETGAFGTAPWNGGENGWVQAAYAEIERWNQQPLAQQIRALILYRWSGDQYSIMDRPGVLNDFRALLKGTDYRWRKS